MACGAHQSTPAGSLFISTPYIEHESTVGVDHRLSPACSMLPKLTPLSTLTRGEVRGSLGIVCFPLLNVLNSCGPQQNLSVTSWKRLLARFTTLSGYPPFNQLWPGSIPRSLRRSSRLWVIAMPIFRLA